MSELFSDTSKKYVGIDNNYSVIFSKEHYKYEYIVKPVL